MKPTVLGVVLLVLSGCVVYERRPYAAEPMANPGQAQRIINQEQAVDQAYRLCEDRDLRVDRVERATLDSDGRWHITLAGYVDWAQVMLDGRDGKLLRGRFRRGELTLPPSPGDAPPQPDDAPPAPSSELD